MSKIMGKRLQYNLAEHCNLKCAGCDHASPVMPAKLADLDSFERDLRALAEVFQAKEFFFVGGEPLLNPQILDFLRLAKKIAIAPVLTLITNGVLLPKAPDELWDLVDFMWISIYPGIKYKVSMEELERRATAHRMFLLQKPIDQFRLTLLNDKMEDPALVREIYRTCALAHSGNDCHTVYDGRYYKCSPAPFIGPRLALRGIEFDNRAVDGVALLDNPNLRSDLEAYLASEEPLAACSYCLGSSGPAQPVRQLNRAGLEAELAADHGGVVSELRLRLSAQTNRDPGVQQRASSAPIENK